MSDWIDPRLSAHLDAWRLSSRREPRRHARERARDAMLQALVLRSPQPRRSMFLFRPRFGHAGLIAAAATVMAAASVAAAGWNAPPGSALFVVRAARQGVMLKLPGSNDAVLHLEFAEQDLADARGLDNPVQSLADARTELTAALAALPSDQASPLWTRYRLDEATFLGEETGGETEGQSPSSTASPRPSEDDRPPGTGAPAVDGEDSPHASPTTSASTPSPSGWGGGDAGGDDGGKSPSGSPGPTHSPDH